MKRTIKILSIVLSAVLILLAFTACLDMPPENPGYQGGGGDDSGNAGNGESSGNSGNGGNGSGSNDGEQEQLPEGAIVSGDYILLDVSIWSSEKLYEIYKYTGSAEEITVPTEIEGGVVSKIREKAFATATNVKSISLPFIGTKSEDNTAPLVAIFGDTIPAALKTVEIRTGAIVEGTLNGCGGLTTFSITGNAVVENAIELRKLTSLEKIYMSGSAIANDQLHILKNSEYFPNLKFTKEGGGYYVGTKENPYVFLMNIEVGEDGHFQIKKETTAITNDALGADGLTSVYVPDEVVYIGDFEGENMVFYFAPTEENYKYKSNWEKWSISTSAAAIYYGVPSAEMIASAEGVEYLVCEGAAIATRVISGKDIRVVNTVECAGSEYAVTQIGNNFAAFTDITDIEISQSVTKIGEYALATPTLDRIFVPAGVSELNRYFAHANTVVYCEADEADYAKYYGFDVYFGISEEDVQVYDGFDYIINGGTALLTRAESDMTEITVGETVELGGVAYSLTVGAGALSGLGKLTTIRFDCVEIPEVIRNFSETEIAAPNLRFTYLSEKTTTFKAFTNHSGFCFVYVGGTVDLSTVKLYSSRLNLFFKDNITASDFNSSMIGTFKGTIYSNSSEPVLVERDGLSYLLYNGVAMVIEADGIDNVTLPYNLTSGGVTYPVEEIGAYAFFGNTEIKNVDLAGCKTVRQHAFEGCTSLARLFVPASVSTFLSPINGKVFFENADTAGKAYYSAGQYTYYYGVTKDDVVIDGDFEYIITDGAASIIDYCDTKAESVAIPNTVAIGGNVYTVTQIFAPGFSNCTEIKSLTLTENIKYVSKDAIKSIKDEALNYYKLNSTTDYGYYLGTAENPYYLYVKPVKYDQKEYTVHSDAMLIMYGALSGCTKIEYAAFPFSGSSKIAPTDTRVAYAFGGSIPTTLYKLYLGGEIWYENSFEGCDKVLYVISSNKLEIIESGALAHCKSLKLETYSGASYLAQNDYRVLYASRGTSAAIHNNTLVIYDDAFYGRTDITAIYLPSNIVSIGKNAFYRCSALKTVSLNSGLKHIGYGAFSNTAISGITLPDTLETIGTGAFSDCASLSEITIPESVTSIGANLCRNSGIKVIYCITLNQPEGWNAGWSNSFEVIWGPYGTGYQTIDGIEYIVISDTEVMVRSLKESRATVIIPESVTFNSGKTYTVSGIRYNAFYGCTELKSVSIPETVKSIESQAFYGCAALERVYLHGGITSIGTSAFAGCTSLVVYAESSSQPSGWSAGCTGKDTPVYWSVSESNLILGDAADFILINGSFTLTRYHASDATFTIPTTEIICEQTFEVTAIGARAFMGYESLKSLYVPSGIKKTGINAFAGCINLVIYLEGTSLGGIASDINPSGCPVYEGINDKNLVTIGEYQYVLFDDTYAILTKHIGTTSACTIEPTIEVDGKTYCLKKIGAMAFSNPDYLTKLIINADLEEIEANAFRNCAFLEYAEINNIVDMYYYDQNGKKVSFASMSWLFADPAKTAEAFRAASSYKIYFLTL